jgi:spore coat protein U-like protein
VNRWLAFACSALIAQGASAATACRLVNASSLAFGPYDVLTSVPNDSLVTIDVACDRQGGAATVDVDMAIGQGSNGSSINDRRMLHLGGSGDFLNYNLFRDVSRSSIWGFSSGVDTVSRQLSIANKSTATASFTIYARIPAQQDVTIGSYRDTVQITVTP